MILSEGDKVFSPGAKCSKMIFVIEGKLQYLYQGKGKNDKVEQALSPTASAGLPSPAFDPGRDPAMSMSSAAFDPTASLSPGSLMVPSSSGATCTYLTEGDWCSEACLWADWVHVGSLQAIQ